MNQANNMSSATPPKIIKLILILQLVSMILIALSTYTFTPLLLTISVFFGLTLLFVALIIYAKVFIQNTSLALKKIDS